MTANDLGYQSRPKLSSAAFPAGNLGHSRPAVGSSNCLCSGCGELFKSLYSFDRHQLLAKDGSVICREPASIGMVRNARGLWVTELREMGGGDE